MSSRPRPPRRPVGGSRPAPGRPRRVAGRAAGVRPEPPGDEEGPRDEAGPRVGEAPHVADDAGPVAREGPVESLLARPRTTAALVVAVVLLAGALAAEGWYLWGKDDPVVSASRPVVTGEIAHRAAVEAASQSTAEILSYGYRNFDDEVEDATGRMTDSFAEQFRRTAAGVKEEFVEARTEQDVKVVAAGVVQASPEQVRALLFLDQYVVKAGEGTAVTPYRALVTVVRTEGGWLVSDIQTR